MHWFADLIAAIGVVLNGIPQGIMALSLGFAVFPTTFSFLLRSTLSLIRSPRFLFRLSRWP